MSHKDGRVVLSAWVEPVLRDYAREAAQAAGVQFSLWVEGAVQRAVAEQSAAKALRIYPVHASHLTDVVTLLEDEIDKLRAEVERLRRLSDSKNAQRIAAEHRAMVAERERDELKTRLAHAEADAEQAIHNEAFNERMKIVAWMRNRVVHKTTASMQTLDELVSICDAIHRGEHE